LRRGAFPCWAFFSISLEAADRVMYEAKTAGGDVFHHEVRRISNATDQPRLASTHASPS
jgi:hypothetical protein